MSCLRFAGLLFVASIACAKPGAHRSTAPDAKAPAACDSAIEPRCRHPVDRFVLARMRELGIEARTAESRELCRRMFVDLVGRIPAPDELAECQRLTPDAMARWLMAKPEYPLTNQRTWGELLGYDLEKDVWYRDVADLDRTVARAYRVVTSSPPTPLRAEIPYSELAAHVVVHPAFYALHQNDDWTARMFSVFLGRTARPDEVLGMRPLLGVWQSRSFCDGVLWHQAFREQGGSAKTADDVCLNDYPGTEWAANFPACARGWYSAVGCRSTVLGREVDFGSDAPLIDNADAETNLVRLGDSSPGENGAKCPDGSQRLQCADRRIVYGSDDQMGKIGRALAPLPAASVEQRARLRQLGEALAARDDFWEAAADRELRRFLGWYQSSFRRPDTDLPEVRRVLALELKRTGSLPELQRLIVTSLLYTAPAEPPPDRTELPVWATAPTKLLAAENWIDSMAIATLGRAVGVCDHRFVASGDIGPVAEAADRRLLRTVDSPLDERGFTADSYYTTAQQLGGCSIGVRPTLSSVSATFAAHRIATLLCGYGDRVLPPGFSDDRDDAQALPKAARHLVLRLLSRDATASESEALVEGMKRCLAAGSEQGCASAEAAVRWACVSIAESAQFSHY